MGIDFKGTGRPGFQGSSHTSVNVYIYFNHQDTVSQQLGLGGGGVEIVNHKSSKKDRALELVAFSMTDMLGASAPNFNITVKDPTSRIVDALANVMVDDTWVDIEITVDNQPYHVVRGIIDSISVQETVVDGAHSHTYVIAGSGFGAIFDRQFIWTNQHMLNNQSAINVSVNETRRRNKQLSNRRQVVAGFLSDYLAKLDTERFTIQQTASQWRMPKAMPLIGSRTPFIENLFFDFDAGGFPGVLGIGNDTKVTVAADKIPYGDISPWDLAMSWSDSQLTELFTCLQRRKGDSLEGTGVVTEGPLSKEESVMSVVYRPKPFFHLQDKENWTRLPTIEVPIQLVTSRMLTKSGQDRYNVFLYKLPTIPEGAQSSQNRPLIDAKGIDAHGVRKFELNTKYLESDGNYLEQIRLDREMVRDWYVLNPFFYTGTIQFATAIPHLQKGMKLVILDKANKTAPKATYYVEAVSHVFNSGTGVITSCNVTRGWHADEQEMFELIERVASEYTLI